MKGKLFPTLDMTNKRWTALLAAGALVAAIGVGSAYAATASSSLLVKVEEGVSSYSTDGGKTWSAKAPDGVSEVKSEDGTFTVTNGTPPRDGQAYGLLTKVDDGVILYSTDNGKTWSEQAPDGSEPSWTISGGGSGAVGLPGEGAHTASSLRVKVENGVTLYSTDDGKTWSETAPDGVTVGEDGKVTFQQGAPSGEEAGKGILSKVENGVRTYSTDGGKTWSSTAPSDAAQ